MNRVSLLIAIALLSLAIVYVLAIYLNLWFAGDSMIGFSPLAFLWIPATIFLGTFGMLISKARRSWIIAASTIVTLALMVSPWFWYEWVLENSWRTSIAQYSEVNKTALRNTDFSSAMLSDVDFPYEGKTVVVPDFRWYCEQHIAAPEGKFRGFVFRSVPHVYINKSRNFIRGIAWIEDPAKVPSDSEYRYQKITDDGWYVWTFGES